jgi:hypothetical protein
MSAGCISTSSSAVSPSEVSVASPAGNAVVPTVSNAENLHNERLVPYEIRADDDNRNIFLGIESTAQIIRNKLSVVAPEALERIKKPKIISDVLFEKMKKDIIMDYGSLLEGSLGWDLLKMYEEPQKDGKGYTITKEFNSSHLDEEGYRIYCHFLSEFAKNIVFLSEDFRLSVKKEFTREKYFLALSRKKQCKRKQ